MDTLKFGGFLMRLILALILVGATYNPSGYSYVHWLINVIPGFTPVLALAGIVLIIGWTIYLRATLRSLGVVGLLLSSAFLGCLVWLVVEWGWLSIGNIPALSWVFIVLLAIVLAVGMSWSHIRRRLSGQVDTDDVQDD